MPFFLSHSAPLLTPCFVSLCRRAHLFLFSSPLLCFPFRPVSLLHLYLSAVLRHAHACEECCCHPFTPLPPIDRSLTVHMSESNLQKKDRMFLSKVLNKGADVNSTQAGGWTALMVAAQMGEDQCARALIEMGADLHLINSEGETALMVATAARSSKVARALVAAGASVNNADVYGWTALMLSAQGGQETVLCALLDSGAFVNQQCTDGHTALMLAAKGKSYACVKKLLERGADVNCSDIYGCTALMCAAESVQSSIVFLYILVRPVP